MNAIERQVLHGLCHELKMVDDDRALQAKEILWLVQTPISGTKDWRGDDGKFRTGTPEANTDYLTEMAWTEHAVEKPLRYLAGAGLIKYQQGLIGEYHRVSLTFQGLELGRKLDSWWGRADVKYREKKEGLIWFLVTVLVSIVTTLITIALKD